MAITTNDLKNGMTLDLPDGLFSIVDFQHVKPGKGGAFVRTKVKSINSGSVVDKTFRAGEKFPRVRTEQKNMQYLYDSGDEVVFMDEGTFEQLSLPHALIEDELPFIQPSSSARFPRRWPRPFPRTSSRTACTSSSRAASGASSSSST